MGIIDILLIVLIFSAIMLCCFLMYYSKKISNHIQGACYNIQNFVDNSIPVLKNLEDITYRTNILVAKAQNYWVEIENIINALREKISYFNSIVKLLDPKTQTVHLIKNLRAIPKGISAFWNKYKRG